MKAPTPFPLCKSRRGASAEAVLLEIGLVLAAHLTVALAVCLVLDGFGAG